MCKCIMCILMYVCTCVSVYVCVYIYIYTYIYVLMYNYIGLHVGVCAYILYTCLTAVGCVCMHLIFLCCIFLMLKSKYYLG